MRAFLAIALASLLFAGCLSSSTHHDGSATSATGQPTAPDPGLPATIKGMEFVANGENHSAEGEWVEGDLVYLSGGSGLRIIDIHDPANPVLLSDGIPDTNSRDVDLIHHPNGHLYAILADSGESNMKLVDVTDPKAPQFVGHTETCVHTVAVV